MTCRYVSSTEPRVIPGRHAEECQTVWAGSTSGGGLCPGCQPCTEPHCRICSRAHADGTCAECLAETREALHEIGRMCDALPEEVEHRGIEGEAMMLLGPAADPEARGHLEASVAAGRVPADYLDHADSDQHPLFVLGSWSMVWRDALEHDDDGGYGLPELVDYLDRTMSYMGDYPHVPFEDFARDLRRCRAHLEAVLHDGEQIERGAPCLKCKRPVLRTTDPAGKVWFRCDHCRRDLTENEYRLAVRAGYIAHADRLTVDDLAIRINTPASTIRRWANVLRVQRRGEELAEHPPLIRPCGQDGNGRKVYRVDDALTIRDSGGDRRRSCTVSIEGVA